MLRRLAGPLIAAAISFAGPAAAADLEPILAKAMQGSKVPAMGLLVIREGKVEAQAVRGVRDAAGAPVRAQDVWHIGSDGKAMTDAMIARLVERGVLSWTTPLERMLPELAASMQPQYRTVTLVQLLSHHSGLPHDIDDEKTLQAMFWDQGPGTPTAQRYAYVARALRDPPVGPTTAFNYSNTGLLIAAVIAERATGKTYEDLMRQEVFGPLGMTHAGFGVTHPPQLLGHVDGRVATLKDTNPAFFAPAGNMYMPLSDWARFCIDQLEGAQGRGKLLKPESYRLMQSPQPGGDAALGFGVQDKLAGRRGPVLIHGGSDGTWFALVALFPASGSGALVTANAGDSMGGDAAATAALKAAVSDLAPPVS
jgi:CubicO group peptidase (beta-lactamase class C family)